MATIDTQLPWEELLSHGRFVRALARTLVRDGAAADDLAQATWLAVARRPPVAVASLRGWLRRVVTNTALQERRSASRRDAREHAAARGEPQPSADAEAAQLEVQQRLLAAVQKLDAKYRSVVVLRFYEGLPPRRIATRLDLPIATVRTQLQRAIEQLRVELDAGSERGREQWLAALAPLAVGAGASIGTVVVASAAAVVLATGATWWAMTGGAAGEAAAEPASALLATQEAQEAGRGEPTGDPLAPTREPAAPAVASARPDVSGRVVDSSGRPIEGAAIELDDRDEATVPRTTVSDVEGRFAFEAVGLGGSTVTVRRRGWVAWQRSLYLDRRRSRELGLDVELLEARTLRGVVVDGEGKPVAGARIVAYSDALRGDVEWPETVSDGGGAFALDGVPTCATWLTVVATGFARRCAGPFDATTSEAPVALVAVAAPTLELAAVDAKGAPLPGGSVRVSVQQRDDFGRDHSRLPREIQDLELSADGRLATRVLPPGRYRFQVSCRALSCSGNDVEATLAAGETTRLELRADRSWSSGPSERGEIVAALTATVRGVVVDGGGSPIAGAEVELERPGATAHEKAVATTTSDLDGSFELAGLAPSSTPLRLRVGCGSPRGTTVIEGELTLDAGAVIEGQRLVVPTLASVSGRVVDPDGRPLQGAIVKVRGAQGTPVTTTATDGSFRFDRLPPGEARVTLETVAASRGIGIRRGNSPEPRDSLLHAFTPGESCSGIELVDGDAPDGKCVHGVIEAQDSLLDDESGDASITIASGKLATWFMQAEEGRFRFDGIEESQVTLVASWRSRKTAGGAFRVLFGPPVVATPGRAATRVSLPTPTKARVQAELAGGPDGGAIREIDVVVGLLDAGGEVVVRSWLSQVPAAGVLAIEGLRPGRYRLELPDEITRDFEVVDESLVDLGPIELAAPKRIEGVVTDASGAPIVGARIGVADFTAMHGDGGGDWLDARQPIVTTDGDGRFSIVESDQAPFMVVADGFAPKQLSRAADGRDQEVVLLACGDLVLGSFPRDLANSDEWNVALVSLDPPESRLGYAPEQRRGGSLDRDVRFARLPVGLYALCFWKVEAGVLRSNDPLPTQTIARKAYRWSVEVKEGLTTTIELSKEW